MSLASDFILKYKDRRQEELINATQLLANRINAQRRAKSNENAALIAAGKPPKHKNINSTINDILQTHHLYVVKKYTPFVNMTYQYFKQGPESETTTIVDSKQIIRFTLNNNKGHFLNDMYIHIIIEPVGNATDDSIKYQYCDYPGIRLLNHCTFNAREGYKIDEYSSDNVILQQHNFMLDSNTRQVWHNMVGQEEAKEAQYYHPDYNMKQSFTFRNGPQTPRPRQPALELWIPLHFWFNTDFGQSFPFAAIDHGQTNIEIEFEKLTNIIRATDRSGNPITLPIKNLIMRKCDLYTNNIFLDNLVFDPVFSRGIRQLIRVNREQHKSLIKSNNSIQLQKMEFALETIFFGFRPEENKNGANHFKHWHLFSRFEQEDAAVPVIVQTPLLPAPSLVVRTAEIFNQTPVINSVSFHIQGKIIIYDSTTNKFFNQVIPYKFKKVNSPLDAGSMMVAWNVDPTKYSPNGYLSLRANHELTVSYMSDVIDHQRPTEFVLCGKSINFMVIRDKVVSIEQVT